MPNNGDLKMMRYSSDAADWELIWTDSDDPEATAWTPDGSYFRNALGRERFDCQVEKLMQSKYEIYKDHADPPRYQLRHNGEPISGMLKWAGTARMAWADFLSVTKVELHPAAEFALYLTEQWGITRISQISVLRRYRDNSLPAFIYRFQLQSRLIGQADKGNGWKIMGIDANLLDGSEPVITVSFKPEIYENG